jgi:hypothetical protein
MSLIRLKEQARQLTTSDKLELISDIIESLRTTTTHSTDKTSIIRQMKGLLKTELSSPTDKEVERMLEERRMEKYQG